MARARNIKPGFFANELLVELPYSTRLLFIGLWTIADREGRLSDRPKRIKMQLFPADDLDVDAALNELSVAQFIERYCIDGQRFIEITNFTKHQSPHVKEPASELPAPDKHQTRPVQESDEHPLIPYNGFPITDSGLLNAESEGGANAPKSQKNHLQSVPKPMQRIIPDDFEVTDEMRSQAEGYGVPADAVDPETEKFRDHFKANGKKMTDWPAAWRNWMRRVSEFAPKQLNGRVPYKTKLDQAEATRDRLLKVARGESA